MEEMPDRAVNLGFEELTPRKVSSELLGHLKTNDRVAVVGRWFEGKENGNLKEIVRLLADRGLQVRLVKGQTPVQDFCFLMNAQKELVATDRSTFSYWAAFLGETSIIRRYKIDNGKALASSRKKLVLPDHRTIFYEIYNNTAI